jgi:hypothetical protein
LLTLLANRPIRTDERPRAPLVDQSAKQDGNREAFPVSLDDRL